MSFRDGNENKEDAQESLKLEDPSNDDDETKVRLDEPDEDADDDAGKGDDEDKLVAAAVGKKPGEQPRKRDGKWAEKKAERGRERREAATQREKAESEQRINRIQADADRRFKQLTEEFDRFRQTAAGGPSQRQDPFDAKLSDIERQLDQELQLIETDANRGYKHYNQLRRQEQELITQRSIATHLSERARAESQRPADPYAYRRPIVASEFPWTDDPRYNDLSKKAAAYREYLINVENKPDTLDTDREALTTTVARFGAEFGLRPPPAAPSQRTRGLYQGPASRGVADRRAAPQEVDLGELGRGTGLSARSLAAAVRSAINDEN